MANTAAGNTASPGSGPAQFFQFGKERTDAMLTMQRELLDEYEKASQAWLARVKSELDFWSELTTKVTSSPSVPEGLVAYRDGISQRMQMAVEDGQRLFDESQKLVEVATGLLNGQAGKAKS